MDIQRSLLNNAPDTFWGQQSSQVILLNAFILSVNMPNLQFLPKAIPF
ncbi:hypothetical protein GPB2148_2311 [marine gamma proteobacterium HTCC2148]|nr:hypothetical protein GPB2148_2311 [marine gamma proteobacterium HTCC2148]